MSKVSTSIDLMDEPGVVYMYGFSEIFCTTLRSLQKVRWSSISPGAGPVDLGRRHEDVLKVVFGLRFDLRAVPDTPNRLLRNCEVP